MEERELKTSLKQRIFISVIAVVMLGSVIASYAAIVIAGNNKASSTSSSSSDSTTISEEKVAEYEEAYDKKLAEFKESTKGDFDKFIKYKSNITAYNENTANDNGVQTKDLKEGSGRTLGADDSDYLAYYVGWCADETIFDSSLDDTTNPTAFAKVLDASLGMIEGWKTGVEGMKLGGVREITVPGSLAYGDQMEICGGYNKPLKFMVMAVTNEDPLKSLAQELDTAYMKVQYAHYGIDYDDILTGE